METSTVPFALVVDDDAIIRMDACDILTDAGFRTLEAASGDAGRAILEAQGASVILLFTDVQMPGHLDGFGLARYAADRWPEIVILVASGNRKPKDDDLPSTATFLAKPFTAELVIEHLQRTLPDGKKPKPLLTAI